MENNAAQKMLR